MTAKYPGTAIGGRPIGTAYGVSGAGSGRHYYFYDRK